MERTHAGARGEVWAGRSNRNKLLWTDHSLPFLVPSALLGLEEREEELGMRE